MNTMQNPTLETTPHRTETTPPRETSHSTAPEINRGGRLDQKIDSLPKETRDMINLMLDDRLPYHILLEELGEAGQGLKPKNLADWVQGRYQDYLKNRENLEQAKTQMEFATDLVRELGDTDPTLIYRASSLVAALQVFKAIEEYGDEALRKMLQVKPASYLGLINSVCNLSSAELKQEQQKHRADSMSK